MRMEKRELLFYPGLIVNNKFDDYKVMKESAKNWLFCSKYRFSSGEFYGVHDGIQLIDLQIGHALQHEGILFEGYSPKDCITIAVVQENFGKLCLNHQKMNLSEIIILDDTKPYDFVSNARTKLGIISIRKEILEKRIPNISSLRDKKLMDINNLLSRTIDREWIVALTYDKLAQDRGKLEAMQERIISVLVEVLNRKPLDEELLTEGEKTSIKIKSFLLNSLEENMSVADIAKQFYISERTFQNGFKSLYGMTPKYFTQMLKLNKANEELKAIEHESDNISKIAMKWGFKHFGRFSEYHKDVFGVLPSEIKRDEVSS